MIGSLLWLIRSAAIQVDIASQTARPSPRSTP